MAKENKKTETDKFKEDILKILGKNNTSEGVPQCAKSHAIEQVSSLSTLRMDCEGCARKSSLSDEICRKQVIGLLAHNPVDRLEFARRLTTDEYEKDDVELLREIAELTVNVNGSPFGIFGPGCGACQEQIASLKEAIIDSLKSDPIDAARGLESPVDKEKVRIKPECTNCVKLRVNTLQHTRKSLKRTKLVTKAANLKTAGDPYKQLFTAKIRPFLSESRIVSDIPAGAFPLQKEYVVEGAKINIFRVPDWNEDLYYIMPPEYELREKPEILEILMQTRDYLLKHAAEGIKSTDNTENTKKKFETICKIKLLEVADERKMILSPSQIELLVSTLVRCTRGLDVIELLLKDPSINDVYVNSPMETTPVYVKHKDYDDCRTNIYLTEDRGNNFVLKFVLKSGIGLSPNSPILDMDLEELKTRVSVIAPPLSPDGIAFSLRCKNDIPWTMPMFVNNGMISSKGAALLTTLVNDQVALLIVGGRGTGKSSFLGAMMSAMNPKYRVLTLEDTLELPVPEMNKAGFRAQRMLARPITTNEGINISADDALRSSLRMGESSIVVGEVRGQEAKVLYESIRVGATGNTVLGTIHGRSPRDIFERVVYDLGIPATSFKATDMVVVTQRLPLGRRVTEIAELDKDVDIEKIGSGAESEKLFNTLMYYDSEKDELSVPEGFQPDKSQIIRFIAGRRGTTPRQVWKDIENRASMYEKMIASYKKNGIHELLEMQSVVDMNKKYISLVDDQRRKNGGSYRNIDYDQVYSQWLEWAEGFFSEFREKKDVN
jgi:archaeal flagellar protein FlaI